MTLTTKETELLKDLKSQEQVCIEKYTRYAECACDGGLKNLFNDICRSERSHLQTINDILSGKEPDLNTSPSAENSVVCTCSPCCCDTKDGDAYLCLDALSMEKHVSSLYDTSVFEFSSPKLRNTLAHIQKEEQNHGEQLYSYMAANGMYEA